MDRPRAGAWLLNESAGGTAHIQDAANRLSTEKQQQFGVLHTSLNANTDVDHVERNCYNMKNGENGTIITVFNDISLINHSCRPNAVVSLESNLLELSYILSPLFQDMRRSS